MKGVFLSMLIGELKRKIPSKLTHSEDFLTSSIFGTLQYLSSPFFIQQILSEAINIQNEPFVLPPLIRKCEYTFWPRLEKSEPDLLLKLTDDDNFIYLVCIEAKYHSRKSSSEDTSVEISERMNHQRDQLAKEVEDLTSDYCLNLLGVNRNSLKSAKLFYLTKDTHFPTDSIETSAKFVNSPSYGLNDFYWLSWSTIYHALAQINLTDSICTYQDQLLITDLKALLVHKNLQCFNGFLKQITFVEKSLYPSNLLLNKFKSVSKSNWRYGDSLT